MNSGNKEEVKLTCLHAAGGSEHTFFHWPFSFSLVLGVSGAISRSNQTRTTPTSVPLKRSCRGVKKNKVSFL